MNFMANKTITVEQIFFLKYNRKQFREEENMTYSGKIIITAA